MVGACSVHKCTNAQWQLGSAYVLQAASPAAEAFATCCCPAGCLCCFACPACAVVSRLPVNHLGVCCGKKSRGRENQALERKLRRPHLLQGCHLLLARQLKPPWLICSESQQLAALQRKTLSPNEVCATWAGGGFNRRLTENQLETQLHIFSVCGCGDLQSVKKGERPGSLKLGYTVMVQSTFNINGRRCSIRFCTDAQLSLSNTLAMPGLCLARKLDQNILPIHLVAYATLVHILA